MVVWAILPGSQQHADLERHHTVSRARANLHAENTRLTIEKSTLLSENAALVFERTDLSIENAALKRKIEEIEYKLMP
jgi:hypothetical protein